MNSNSGLPGGCLTTAMGILPHTSIEEALSLALGLDIPFWPQLPKYSFYEDMYVQVSEHFPGIRVDEENLRVQLDIGAFYEELPAYAEKMDDPSYLELSPKYSAALDAFLAEDLSSFPAIRGQSIGPVSFGLKIADRNMMPIIYYDEVRALLFDFIARKLNAQYEQLRAKNENAFVWLDEPGLEILFGSFTGYSSDRARTDYRSFLDSVSGPRGVHLCGNPDWSFLLNMDLDILSVDTFGWGHIFTRYHDEVISFLKKGGIISWGIVPTLTEEVESNGVESLLDRLDNLWDYLAGQGIDKRVIMEQAWLAPARCCLVNTDGAASVEKAFAVLKEISRRVREKHSLD